MGANWCHFITSTKKVSCSPSVFNIHIFRITGMAVRTSYFSSLDPDAIRPRCKEKCIVRDHLSYMDEKRYLRTC